MNGDGVMIRMWSVLFCAYQVVACVSMRLVGSEMCIRDSMKTIFFIENKFFNIETVGLFF